jgi:two-component system, NtrC family, nitrogen regulation sensor histidine kinase NtrY
MIHIIKNNKWVIASSLICILFGVLTFFTFINQSFIKLTDSNLQILLFIDSFFFILFFTLIIKTTYKIFKEKKEGKLGSQTSLRYITFFTTITLVPSIIIAIFSLVLFNVGLQKYFDQKIKSAVNNSSEVAKNYLEQSKDSIESDILLILIDVNSKSRMYYDQPKNFLNLLTSQRMLRRLDELYILDSAGNLIMSTISTASTDFVPPPDEAFLESLNGKPVKITDPVKNRTSALVKLNNFIDTYLYIVRYMDPKLIRYLDETEEAVTFYYSVQDKKTGIKITFAIIYVLLVSLLLFLSLIISINFSSRFTKPIINLIGASEKISSGDLTTKVPEIETDKEIEKLNENFNLMIDRLKKQQDKLIFSERHTAWESVARKLAHEIKNPLTPIQLSIDRLREKYMDRMDDDKDNFSNYLETINKQIRDIENLVNEFSDFARMPKPIMKKVNIYETMNKVINLHELSESKIIFDFIKNKSIMYVKFDESQLNRVFINLIKNSIESINEKVNKNVTFKGKINIDIKQDSDYIYIEILDNGVGFDQIDKAKMLTPYYTTKTKGTGLGLAVVTKIISDHNSTITFNSIKNGAKVEIIMPRYYD